jgi:hypothetical protein
VHREFISYPKSGRSRLRFGLHHLGLAEQVRFHHDGFEFNAAAKPPHDFSIQKRLNRLAKIDRVVFLKRDPRDVMVSLFHQVTGRFQDFFHYSGDISAFIRDPYFGAAVLKQFFDMWEAISHEREILIVTYEECAEDAVAIFEKVTRYYGFDTPVEACREAVEASTLEKMKKIEESGEFSQPWLRKRHGFGKVRRGKVGGYADSLPVEDIEFLNTCFGIGQHG